MKITIIIVLLLFAPNAFSQIEFELNDSIQYATNIETFTNYQEYIGFAKDLDYYKFNLNIPSEITIEVTKVPENIELEVFIFDNELNLVYSNYTLDEGLGYDFKLTRCKGGFHYLLFRDGANVSVNGGSDFNNEVPYEFNIKCTDLYSIDPFECNDNFDEATQIVYCIPTLAKINSWIGFNDSNNMINDDKDYYKINLPENRNIDFSIEDIPINRKIRIRIFDPDSNYIKAFESTYNGIPMLENFNTNKSGYYYFEISDRDKNFDYESSYKFQVGCILVTASDKLDFGIPPKLFPIPTTESITLKFANDQNCLAQINIVNINGQLIYNETIYVQNSVEINTSNFDKGFYYIIYKSDNQEFKDKFVKQ